MAIKITPQTMKVLTAIMESPGASGADLCRSTRLATGTLYPILLRMEKGGAVVSEWEAGDPSELGRPRRRFYRVTAEGARLARETAREWSCMFGGLVTA